MVLGSGAPHWILDYFSGWAGEWGQVVRCILTYRGPAFTGDATYMTAKIIGKEVDKQNRNVVQADFERTNQLGNIMTKATATLALPKK